MQLTLNMAKHTHISPHDDLFFSSERVGLSLLIILLPRGIVYFIH